MDIEEQIDEPVIDSVRSDLEQAFEDVEAKAASEPVKPDKTRDETGKFAKNEKVEATATVDEKIPDAPRSWTSAEKSEWAIMTPNQRAAVQRRESEVELGFTKLDEERNFGKSLKEVINPYMSIIQAEGGTPATAVQSLLNTAYILRTGGAAQKAALFHQLAQQYGVDLSQPATNSTVQPDQVYNQLTQKITQLEQQIRQQPENFQKQQEGLVIKSQIDAFAADPKNVHYEKLKPVMASLLSGGQATNLQDAYDKASWADPEIRSANMAIEREAKETQRIADIKAKAGLARRASVSVKGSPSINPVSNGKSNGSIADDLRDAWDMHA